MTKRTVTFLFLLLFFAFQFTLKAQCNLLINGKVETKEAEIVTVGIAELNKFVVSDSLGNFSFSDLCKGNYTLKISGIGLVELDTVIELNESVLLNLKLQKNQEELNEVIVEVVMAKFEDIGVVNRIDEQMLESNSGKQLAEVLKDVPGVTEIKSSAGNSKPVLNGLYGNRILILNSGVRQMGQNWNINFAPDIDPFVASKIEVIQGPSSIKYGTDAMGGVISIFPVDLKEVNKLIQGDVSSVYFSNNRQYSNSLNLEGGLKKIPLKWRLQGTLTKAGNMKAADYYLENTGFEEKNFLYQLGYFKKRFGAEVYYSQYNKDLGVYRGSHIHTLRDLVSTFEGNVIDTVGFSYEIGRPKQQAEHELFKASMYYNINLNNKINIIYARQFNRRQEFDVYHGFEIIDESLAPQLGFKITSHELNANWQSKQENSDFEVGVNGSSRVNTITNAFYLPKYDALNFGVYGLEKWYLGKFKAELGARFEREDREIRQRFEGDTLPTKMEYNTWAVAGGAVYKPIKQLKLHVNSSYTNRPPSINELFNNGINHAAAAFYVGNHDLEVERMINLATTVEYNSDLILIQSTYYTNWFSNYIFLSPALAPTVTIRGIFPTYEYLQAKAKISGLTNRIEVFPKKWLSVGMKSSIIRGDNFDLDDYLALMPQDLWSYYVSINKESIGQFNNLRGVIEWQDFATQNRVPENTEPIPAPNGYKLLNGNLNASLVKKKYTIMVGVGVDNILNTSYRGYLNRWRFYADEMGRNVYVRLKVGF